VPHNPESRSQSRPAGGDSPLDLSYPRPKPDQHRQESPEMAEHKPGSMDITTQEKTFEGFVKFVVRTTIAIIVLLIFIALVNG
jgi:hypothetical protein